MKAILVRIGIDQTWGGWNAPVDPSTRAFVYVPITESATKFGPDCGRTLPAFKRALDQFCGSWACEFKLPRRPPCEVRPSNQPVHLDPDFEHLTYGDDGRRRGVEIAKLAAGDLLVFYAGLRPCGPWTHELMYAIIGLYVVDEVVSVAEIPRDRWPENAHTRRIPHRFDDIVVRARAGQSGRLQECIPIGEWRERAYRVRNDLLREWGGLSVKNGYIQRSAVPPRFRAPEQFHAWFKKQAVGLVASNF
jgi:hypothetical protein